jgi:hypothetical protein
MGKPGRRRPERFIRAGSTLHLHRHAFVTPQVLDRAGWLAAAAVAPTWAQPPATATVG